VLFVGVAGIAKMWLYLLLSEK